MSETGAQIPDVTVARLVTCQGVLAALARDGVTTVSSNELAEAAGASPAQLRKDLSHLGSYGTRGVGYDVRYLLFQLEQRLGGPEMPVVIVGVGNLGRALASHTGFLSRGFRIAGLIDADPGLTGARVDGQLIMHDSELEDVITRTGSTLAVIATPSEVAQTVADRLVACGVVGLLNFAPVTLSVPDEVTVRRIDLGSELQLLAYHSRTPDAVVVDSPVDAPILESSTIQSSVTARSTTWVSGQSRGRASAEGPMSSEPMSSEPISNELVPNELAGAETL